MQAARAWQRAKFVSTAGCTEFTHEPTQAASAEDSRVACKMLRCYTLGRADEAPIDEVLAIEGQVLVVSTSALSNLSEVVAGGFRQFNALISCRQRRFHRCRLSILQRDADHDAAHSFSQLEVVTGAVTRLHRLRKERPAAASQRLGLPASGARGQTPQTSALGCLAAIRCRMKAARGISPKLTLRDVPP